MFNKLYILFKCLYGVYIIQKRWVNHSFFLQKSFFNQIKSLCLHQKQTNEGPHEEYKQNKLW